MTSLRVTLALMLVMVAVLLAAGCAGQQPVAEKQTSKTTVTVTSAPIIVKTTLITPVLTECPLPVNGSYWIRINPISNVTAGDPFFVNGTTNIPSGMTLNIDISQYQFRALPHYEPPHISGTVEILKNESCSNAFSFYSNSTDLEGSHLIIAEVYSLDLNLSGYNYPINRSEFYIISPLTTP